MADFGIGEAALASSAVAAEAGAATAAASGLTGAIIAPAAAAGILGTGITASEALSGFGALTSAYGALTGAAGQSGALKYQADVQQQQADRELQIGQLNARRLREQNDALMGRQRAALAASGADLSTGSALLLQSELAKDSSYEEALALAGGQTDATRLQQDAALTGVQAGQASRAGYFRAGSTLLTAASKFG